MDDSPLTQNVIWPAATLDENHVLTIDVKNLLQSAWMVARIER
jgi:hypothetical protein